MRESKLLFDDEGYACHWQILCSAQAQKFPRQGQTDICSWVHNLMTSVSFFAVCPSSAWGG